MSDSLRNKTLAHTNNPAAAWTSALAAVYGPFLVAAIVTWTQVSCDHCRQTWAQMLPTFPGWMLLNLISTLTLRRYHGLPPALTTTLAAFISIALVAFVSRLARHPGLTRAFVLLATASAASLLAWAAYHIVRA